MGSIKGMYWDNDINNRVPHHWYFNPGKNITHRATCVIGDLKITKSATLEVTSKELEGPSANQPWYFQPPSWAIDGSGTSSGSSGSSGSSNNAPGVVPDTGKPCNDISTSGVPASVVNGTSFSFNVSCGTSNYITVEDRQPPSGSATITDGTGSVSISRDANYFTYQGISYDWTKPMEFRVNCYDKKGGKKFATKR